MENLRFEHFHTCTLFRLKAQIHVNINLTINTTVSKSCFCLVEIKDGHLNILHVKCVLEVFVPCINL